MKKILFAIFALCMAIAININAATTPDQPVVEMVSYEQSWTDDEGTIALKNNTSENIHNVSFLLEYLDMKGNPMDYEIYAYDIDIAPGMTKKLNVPAYEYGRFYHYYKTKDEIGGHPKFKLRYELKGYNLTSKEKSSYGVTRDNTNESSDGITVLFLIITFLIVLGIYVGLYVMVAVMAQRRNRNPAIWLLLSFIATPVLICLILLAIGSKHYPQY